LKSGKGDSHLVNRFCTGVDGVSHLLHRLCTGVEGVSHLVNRLCTGEKVRKFSDWFDDLIAKYDVHGGFALDITANNDEIKYAVGQRGGTNLYKVDDNGYKADEFDIYKYELFFYSRFNKGTAAEPEWSTGDDGWIVH